MMAQLIQRGVAADLQQAYDMAESWSPDVKAARAKARNAPPQKTAQERVDKVRNASRSGIVAKNTAGRKGKDRDVESQVSDAYDKLANR
jgi:hypothetical protein